LTIPLAQAAVVAGINQSSACVIQTKTASFSLGLTLMRSPRTALTVPASDSIHLVRVTIADIRNQFEVFLLLPMVQWLRPIAIAIGLTIRLFVHGILS
jgi:hypothetical protein